MRTFLGVYGDKVVYLDHRSWVQVVDMTKVAPNTGPDVVQPERYLFIPQEVIGSSNGVDGLVTGAGTVIFPKERELAVVKNLFEWPFHGEPFEGRGPGMIKRVGTWN